MDYFVQEYIVHLTTYKAVKFWLNFSLDLHTDNKLYVLGELYQLQCA